MIQYWISNCWAAGSRGRPCCHQQSKTKSGWQCSWEP